MLNSDLDNSITESEIKKEFLRRIDLTKGVLDSAIIKLFQIDLLNLIRNKISLSKHFYIAPSEIDRMYYWEYEFFLDEVNQNIKAENEKQEKENDKYKHYNPNSISKNISSSMPKMPKMQTPKFK